MSENRWAAVSALIVAAYPATRLSESTLASDMVPRQLRIRWTLRVGGLLFFSSIPLMKVTDLIEHHNIWSTILSIAAGLCLLAGCVLILAGGSMAWRFQKKHDRRKGGSRMSGLETLYNVVTNLFGSAQSGERAADPHLAATDRVQAGLSLSTGTSVLGAAGSLIGATRPAVSAVLGSGAIGSAGVGTGLLAASLVLGAGAFGFGAGSWLDKRLGLSDKLSDAMVGSVDDDMLLHGAIPLHHPGISMPEEMLAAQARLPALEAGRQTEIARLSQMWTDSGALMGAMQRMQAATPLKEEYDIDMVAIEASETRKREEEKRSPAATMQRETERQVTLSEAIQNRDKVSNAPSALAGGVLLNPPAGPPVVAIIGGDSGRVLAPAE